MWRVSMRTAYGQEWGEGEKRDHYSEQATIHCFIDSSRSMEIVVAKKECWKHFYCFNPFVRTYWIDWQIPELVPTNVRGHVATIRGIVAIQIRHLLRSTFFFLWEQAKQIQGAYLGNHGERACVWASARAVIKTWNECAKWLGLDRSRISRLLDVWSTFSTLFSVHFVLEFDQHTFHLWWSWRVWWWWWFGLSSFREFDDLKWKSQQIKSIALQAGSDDWSALWHIPVDSDSVKWRGKMIWSMGTDRECYQSFERLSWARDTTSNIVQSRQQSSDCTLNQNPPAPLASDWTEGRRRF